MTYQNPISKSKVNPSSLRLAINAHCYMCMGGSSDDIRTKNSIALDIKGCTSNICPLRPVRPFNPSTEQVSESNKLEVNG